MKRTIFKMGREFCVDSTTDTSRFVIKENIEEWMHSSEWEFEFDELVEDETFPMDSQGTKITLHMLHYQFQISPVDLHRVVSSAKQMNLIEILNFTVQSLDGNDIVPNRPIIKI